MLKSKLTAILPLMCTSLAGVSQAQVTNPKSDLADRVVPVIEAKIAARYPFPDIADRYVAALAKALKAGRYNGLTGKELAKALNADIQGVHKDLHLGIHSSHALFLQATAETGGPLSPNEKERERLERHEANFGFTSVEVDPRSDTAYIKSAGPWWPEKETFEIAAGTMAIASEAHNIIIDVRGNPGGSGAVGQFLASYFYEPGEGKILPRRLWTDRRRETAGVDICLCARPTFTPCHSIHPDR